MSLILAADLLGIISVVRGIRGFGGLYKLCICVARVGVGCEGGAGEWIRGLGPVGTGGALDVCFVFCCADVYGVDGEWVEFGWSGVMSVTVVSLD